MHKTTVIITHKEPISPEIKDALQQVIGTLLITSVQDVAVVDGVADIEEQVVDKFTMSFLTQAIEVSVVHDGLLFDPPVVPRTTGTFERIRLANNPPATIAHRVSVIEAFFPPEKKYLLHYLLKSMPNFYVNHSTTVELQKVDG